MSYVVLAIAIVILAAYAAQRIAWTDVANRARHARRTTGASVLTLARALSGKGQLSRLAAPMGLLGWRLATGRRNFPGVEAPDPEGETSRATTDHLDVTLDHDTGEIRGRILKGFFAGRRLQTLSHAELAHLWQDCRVVDPRSGRVVEAFLDSQYPAWREEVARGEAELTSGPNGRMPHAEARRILGLRAGASEEDIRRAHRELMMRLHPDRGGSTYLAAKVNEAKGVLLGGRE